MKRVVIESPYAGDVERNVIYARRAMHDSIVNCEEAPYASHLLYTQQGILDDSIPEERELGIKAGLIYHDVADYIVFYMDYSMSRGMGFALDWAEKHNKGTIFRYIGKNP
jgi:hypothetical protein